jgi:rare lipoprotein A
MKFLSSTSLGCLTLCVGLGVQALPAAAQSQPVQAQSAATDPAQAQAGDTATSGTRHRQLNFDSSLLSMLTLPHKVNSDSDASDDTTLANGADNGDSPDAASSAGMMSATLKVSDASNFTQFGRASWYGNDFHGRRTADGERFDMNAFTAAHRTLPLASYVRVTNQDNGKSVIVKINDRGPFTHNRVLDLSYAAAKVIGLVRAGIARVKIQGLSAQEARAANSETLASDANK